MKWKLPPVQSTVNWTIIQRLNDFRDIQCKYAGPISAWNSLQYHNTCLESAQHRLVEPQHEKILLSLVAPVLFYNVPTKAGYKLQHQVSSFKALRI